MSGLRIYNTLTGRKDLFQSAEKGVVKMFVCGPTVQGLIHMGHARTYLFYDALARYLAHLGNRVEFVLNITDIDEGIVKGAASSGVSVERFASKYEAAFKEDMKALEISSVSSFDRVSRHIPGMISQVEGLLQKGSAYHVGNSVFFSVDSFPQFGRLSGQTLRQISLRPLEIGPGKRNQADFSLWRESQSSEQRWDSPWGKGTPGWHIQDTAVSSAHFGPQYDIHGGARELVYPHHEAQIAEMESLTGLRPFVRYWVHTGLLNTKREKMAKSKGNVLHVRDVLREYGAGALRMYMYGLHHRKDAEFSERLLSLAEEDHSRFVDNVTKLRQRAKGPAFTPERGDPFYKALDDDLHTERAMSRVLNAVRVAVQDGDDVERRRAIGLADAAATVLGIGAHASD